ncbi:MAG: hypothetical protein IIZ92_24310, partial [Aquincola sp.]|nr:hypothetical protein [Aquincola sp.]
GVIHGLMALSAADIHHRSDAAGIPLVDGPVSQRDQRESVTGSRSDCEVQKYSHPGVRTSSPRSRNSKRR